MSIILIRGGTLLPLVEKKAIQKKLYLLCTASVEYCDRASPTRIEGFFKLPS